ncbi:MAG: HlyD family efflux transporter periplasmic adaptor subunit [Nitriliruptoraceae bacterium]
MRRGTAPSVVALAAAALLLAACTGEEEVTFGSAEVTSGPVVQTVAAAGTLEPADRTTVSAPSSGEIETLQVADGEVVEAGDPLFTLRSEALEQQLAQAESAVESAELFAGTASGAGIGLDVAPLVGALRAQLDAVIPPVLGSLEDQVQALEDTVTAVTAATRQSGEATAAALRDLADDLGGQLPEELDVDPELITAPEADDVTVEVDTTELEASLHDARQRLRSAQAEYRSASAQLGDVEADAQAQAAQAARTQAAATELQREQAEIAVSAVQDRLDELAVVAPAGGVVELSRGGAATGGGVGALEGLDTDLGSLADSLGGGGLPGGAGGDVGGLLGGGTGAPDEGPPAVGARVGAGQPILTIFDLDGFTVAAEVDELDVVEVEVGQSVLVLVDAFPDAQLAGVVDHIALEPRTAGMGGALYPVTVRLVDRPEEVSLRIGMTVSVEIQVREVEGELVVPSGALLRRGDDEVVHVVRDGVARRVPVTVLALGDGTAAVRGDLEVGDTVVTSGVELLEDGQEVTLAPDEQAATPAGPSAAGPLGPGGDRPLGVAGAALR